MSNEASLADGSESGVEHDDVKTDKQPLKKVSELEKIREKLDAVIADMGNALHAGNIDDMPYASTASNACDWCDYKAVCRNKEKKREVKVPRFEQALKELEEGSDNE